MTYVNKVVEFLASYGVDMYNHIFFLLMSFNLDFLIIIKSKLKARKLILLHKKLGQAKNEQAPGIDLCIFQGVTLALIAWIIRYLLMLSLAIGLHLFGEDTIFHFFYILLIICTAWILSLVSMSIFASIYWRLDEVEVLHNALVAMTSFWCLLWLITIGCVATIYKSSAELQILNNNRMHFNNGTLDLQLKGSLATEDKKSLWLLSRIDSKPANWPENVVWTGYLVIPSNDISAHFMMEGIKQIIYSRDSTLARIKFDPKMKVRSITLVEYIIKYEIIDLYYQPVLTIKELKRWDFEKNQILPLE